MQTVLRAALCVLAALVLWVDAAINIVIHPLTARSAAISVALASLGTVVVAAEPALRSPRRAHSTSSWHSMLVKSAFLSLAAVVMLDGLKGLPCPSPRAVRDKTSRTLPTAGQSELDALKTNGTSVYLVRSLAPQCVQFLGPDLQGVPSMAWVNVAPRRTSRVLMLAGVATTLTASLLFCLLGVVQRARGGAAVAGKDTRDDEETASSPPRALEAQPDRPVDLLGELLAADKHNAPSSFGLIPNGRTCTSRLSAPGSRCDDAASHISGGGSSAIPSVRGEGSACTPALRRIPSHPDSPSCALFGRSPTLPVPPPPAHSASNSPVLERRDSPGLHYAHVYGGTVDFASGCIMHQPIFSQRKRRGSSQQDASFATLLPPDFSRPSFHSLPALSPRRKVKSVPNVTGKMNRRSDAKAHIASAKATEIATSSKYDPPAALSPPADEDSASQLAQVGHREPKGKGVKPTKHDVAKHHLRPAQREPARLNTADSMRSIGSATMAGRAPTSRPGTGASARSTGSLRLTRQSLFAALDARLGTRSSVVSHDASCGVASACSYDSQGGCSAGTFGDGATDSPAPSPKLRFPRMPSPRTCAQNGASTSPVQSSSKCTPRDAS